MSKTFKALQRAAEEQARRLRRESEPGQPPPAGSTPPNAAAARRIALAGSASPPATPGPRTSADGVLRSEVDLALRELLEASFRPACPHLRIGEDGWVHGALDRDALRALRRRAALLHCLVKDPETSFWFWGSAREAEALARSTGYLLDPVD